MKRFINLLLVFSIFIMCTAVPVLALDDTDNYTVKDLDLLFDKISEQQIRMDAALTMEESARTLGFKDTHEVIKLAQKEYQKAYNLCSRYQEIYNNLIAQQEEKWLEKEREYPYATYIWRYFKELGYSDAVCAGIMGNLMSEVGGSTLHIKYWATNSSGYYGMCQWSKSYSDIWGKSLKEQCDYLAKTIKYEFDTFGYAYKKGFNYEAFLSLTNEKDAALAFAKCYERCASGGYGRRQRNATKAYNYFVD